MTKQARRWSQEIGDGIDEGLASHQFPTGSLSEVFFQIDQQSVHKAHLEFLRSRPQIGAIFADAFRLEMASNSRYTRKNRTAALKRFFEFLEWIEKESKQISAVRDLTFEVLGEFPNWLTEIRGTSERSCATTYLNVANHLKVSRRLHPNEFPEDFEIPALGFSYRIVEKPNTIPLEDFANILRAAELEVETTEAHFKQGDVPGSGQTLIPFMILIAANTAMNAFSLYGLTRDCLETHPLDNNAVYLKWRKARASFDIQKQLHSRRSSRTIELINFVLEFTRPLVEQAGMAQQKFLFLYEYVNRGTRNLPKVGSMVSPSTTSNHLREFCKKHNLPAFSFQQIRPTTATHNHFQNGGNIRKTKLLLGHKYLQTTVIYINKQTLQPVYDKAMRLAQEAMVGRVTVIAKPATEAVADLSLSLPNAKSNSIARGEFSTGFGRCKDPFDSPQPGQRKGQICTLFLSCLTCPNALFFVEDLPRVIALRDHLASLRISMSNETWERLYEEHLNILDNEIIGLFSDEQIADAKLKAMHVSDMKFLLNKTTVQ